MNLELGDSVDFLAKLAGLPEELVTDLQSIADRAGSLAEFANALRVDRRLQWFMSHEFHHPDALSLADHLFCVAHTVSSATPADGFVTDAFGLRTRTSTATKWAPLDGTLRPWTFEGCFEHDAIEWFALLDSVKASRARNAFNIMEIGAGWGPWITAGAVFARRQGITDVRLTAVEGDQQRFDFIDRHRADNGVADLPLTAHHAVIAPYDGTALFPVMQDSTYDMGFAAVYGVDDPGAISRDYRGAQREHTVHTALSLSTLLNESKPVDFLHVDVQNSEAEVLKSAPDQLDAKCRRLYVATHSRAVEWQIAEDLMARNWTLLKERPCQMHCGEDWAKSGRTWPLVKKDGAQYWINQSIA